jgi:hypothetical protein
LLLYPFCFLFIATAVSFLIKKTRSAKLITMAMLGYMLISTAIFFPWFISYTNELITDKKTVFRKIRDSSIDYGQNSSQLQKFRKAHSEYIAGPPEPKAGKYIVPAFQLINYTDRENASWLLHFEPVDHHQYSMFLFHISEQDVMSLK